MKRLFIAAVFAAAAYFGMQCAKPSFAGELYNVGAANIAGGWFAIAGAALLGFILSGKK